MFSKADNNTIVAIIKPVLQTSIDLYYLRRVVKNSVDFRVIYPLQDWQITS